MPDPDSYTVGWVSALTTEYVAAQVFLDEKHDRPDHVSANDGNTYTLGRIGKHNVVIGVLPDGEYGIAAASGVARNMMHSFPNIRIGLMVGIGGGAPNQQHDIRLGDVVVSASRDGHGGVFQYDFGKTIQDQEFRHTGFLNQPPELLRTAVADIRAEYEIDGHQLEEAINNVLAQKPRLRRKYGRPELGSDLLFTSTAVHRDGGSSCTVDCIGDGLNLVKRHDRTEEDDNPAIHYGTIASANQLMKNAVIRDKLAIEKGVLCFEMEAAGLMNHFPCLVIRGICDYSDSHKNKEWQGYAAMTAAAYGKDLLSRIPPNKVEHQGRIKDIVLVMADVQKAVESHRDIAQKQSEDRAEQRQSDKNEECLQAFRLTSSNKDSTYESSKDLVADRLNGTCEWFLRHENFQKWLRQPSGPLLVSADPGCGKSVLAKYLIDQELPRSATICYFFFKDPGQNTVRQALCALLHQLLSQKEYLMEHATEQWKIDGPGLVNSTNSLWTILDNAVGDPQAGPIIIVLDALDECDASDFENLLWNVERQLQKHQSGAGNLKYLLTSRPYEQIVSTFRPLLDVFPYIRIPGEEESESISQEVGQVIRYRVDQLAKEKELPDRVKSHLADKLLAIPHRTYLWVYLVFDYLKKEGFKKTPKGVDSAIATLPKNVNQAYAQILNKSKDDPTVRKALTIILAATRPLTLSEMNVAMNIDNTLPSLHDVDLEEEEHFKSRLRSWCGLFISIYHGNIHFLHQTAREFLLADLPSAMAAPSGPSWHHSITRIEAHTVLAEVCVYYLNFFNSDSSPAKAKEEAGHHLAIHAFLDYSAKNWGLHFYEARINKDAAIIPLAMKICDSGSRSYQKWFEVFWQSAGEESTELDGFLLASYFGHETIVQLMLETGGIDINSTTASESLPYSNRTALYWASRNGHEPVVKLLLGEDGIEVNAKDAFGRTSLWHAADNGYEGVVKLLLSKDGIRINPKDGMGQTPLWLAVRNRHEAVAKLLIAKDNVDINIKNHIGQTPLWCAAENGHAEVVKMLLNKEGVDVNVKDSLSRTPLWWASYNGHDAVVKLLLDKDGIDVNSKDYIGQTPLWVAASDRNEAVVELLLGKDGVNTDLEDNFRRQLLWLAVSNGDEAVAKLLLSKEGVDINTKDDYGRTLLSWGAEKGHEAVIRLLLENGADLESKDSYDRTPLEWSLENGHDAVVNLLLDKMST
ncbi:hypothetical protein FDECE_14648 [Fusarium decemcellulare]|nr:hypothetical protein FDECE_14648 [Fusarium decemcellulare]